MLKSSFQLSFKIKLLCFDMEYIRTFLFLKINLIIYNLIPTNKNSVPEHILT